MNTKNNLNYESESISINMEFFITTINKNEIGAFFGYQKNADGEDYYNSRFGTFKNKLKGYYDFVTQAGTQEPKYLEEIIFLSKYIDLLFKEAKNENGNLLSVFESEDDKTKFYQLLPEYFGGNYHNKIMEIRQHTPGFTKEDDERLAQEGKQRLEEEKRGQEEKDNKLVEELKGKILTDEEEKAILSIFDEE